MDDGAENADGVAGFFEAVLLRFQQTGEARRRSGADGHGEAVAGHGGGVNPGRAILDGKIVDQETRLEIVGAIENEVEAGEQVSGVARTEVGDEAFDGTTGVDRAELALGGDGFGERGEGIGFVKEGLALKIRGLDKIAVDDAQFSDACANQEICGGRTDCAASDNDGAGGEQALLAFIADGGKENLARVFFVKRRVHFVVAFVERCKPTKRRRLSLRNSQRSATYDSAKVGGTGNAAMLRFV